MSGRAVAELAAADQRHVWHPFTAMHEWCDPDDPPLVLVRGEGATLIDTEGNRYFDGNSSIWTNVHGHGHPRLVEAIRRQAGSLAHASFLGTTNVPAIELAEALVRAAPGDRLTRVFYSDDGSTAIECALRLALQFRQLVGEDERRTFVAFEGAYHGDTLGAASLGGIDLFHGRLAGLGVPVRRVASIGELEEAGEPLAESVAAVVIEPLVQGAAGMRTWPRGLLADLRAWCDRHGVHLILDEVMTGFGRTGTLFACEQENVVPDFLALAKGLTGGTVPLAATLTTDAIFAAFVGEPRERTTFHYGHSYSGNPVGCAAALASLAVFEEERVLERIRPRIARLGERLAALASAHRRVGEVRQCGLIAGIDLVRDAGTRESFPRERRAGAAVCRRARRHGLLTRPIGDTVVLMPPLCTTADELDAAVDALETALADELARA